MKRLVALVIAAGTLWYGSCRAAAGPKLVFRQAEYDFGKAETGGTGEHAFVLTNRGDQPLVIRRAKSSCGCCTCECDAQLPELGEIRPGESAQVVLRWTIQRYTGDFRQSQVLLTNDPERPEVTLSVSGRVVPSVRIVPEQLVFTRIAPGQPAEGEVRVYGYRAEALKIVGHEFSDPTTAADFEVTSGPLSADEVAAERDARSACLVRVKVKPGVAAGPFRQDIVLVTNVDTAPRVELPVQGAVGSDLILAGFGWEERTGVLTLGTISADKGTERKLVLIARGLEAKHVALKAVRVVPDQLRVEVGQPVPVGDGAVFRIPLVFRIPPGSAPVNHLGTKADELGQIVFRTGHPRQPELRILVRFAVTPSLPPPGTPSTRRTP